MGGDKAKSRPLRLQPRLTVVILPHSQLSCIIIIVVTVIVHHHHHCHHYFWPYFPRHPQNTKRKKCLSAIYNTQLFSTFREMPDLLIHFGSRAGGGNGSCPKCGGVHGGQVRSLGLPNSRAPMFCPIGPLQAHMKTQTGMQRAQLDRG